MNINKLFPTGGTTGSSSHRLDIDSIFKNTPLNNEPNLTFTSQKIIEKRERRQKEKQLIYKQMLQYCHRRIEESDDDLATDMIFSIVPVIPECKEYDPLECLQYVSTNLRNDNFDTIILSDTSMFITWKDIEHKINNSNNSNNNKSNNHSNAIHNVAHNVTHNEKHIETTNEIHKQIENNDHNEKHENNDHNEKHEKNEKKDDDDKNKKHVKEVIIDFSHHEESNKGSYGNHNKYSKSNHYSHHNNHNNQYNKKYDNDIDRQLITGPPMAVLDDNDSYDNDHHYGHNAHKFHNYNHNGHKYYNNYNNKYNSYRKY